MIIGPVLDMLDSLELKKAGWTFVAFEAFGIHLHLHLTVA
jgi:hypothetical protein